MDVMNLKKTLHLAQAVMLHSMMKDMIILGPLETLAFTLEKIGVTEEDVTIILQGTKELRLCVQELARKIFFAVL